jgi:aminoglycoside phosphotransferase (APT) family kinase protein
VWVHGDLLPSNVLVDADGGLAAVIDFAPGVADPAVELIAAWNLVPAEHRDAFRDALDVDDDTWARGRGWALVQAAVALPYYRDINPGMTAMARYALRQIEAG